MLDRCLAEVFPAAEECRKAVFLLADEITRRTGLRITVNESASADFVMESTYGGPLQVEAVSVEAETSLPEGFLLVEDHALGDAASCEPCGSVARHYVRTIEAVSRNAAAAGSVLQKLGQLKPKKRKKRRKKR